ncbi:MAG TPA: glycoside hydrolase family 5 protein [Acetobacteraceae bacterium]|nr:glycoside hydrolase family 5 protein [Acetobacteraceae bacterium]
MTASTYTASGRGGDLLPSGYLSTQGNQIVDANGNPVRIDSIGWNGTAGPAGSALQGLWAASYESILDSMKADGFNAVRIPWTDVNLNAVPANTPALGTIDFSQNPDLKGLTTLQTFQKIVAYASQIGLKIIFDHHNNEGSGGQQANGLWFDSGPGTNGTDGSGHTGTVTAAKFQQDWVQLAQTFAGNSTVIGYDLDNEPTSVGKINWGQGGPTDIKAMYQTVGNAIQAVDPGALIICEGPQFYSPPPSGSGMNSKVAAPEGDLTGVATNPVVLNAPNKVVYSVHEYPKEISAITKDSGTAAIQRYNQVWGYLVSQNIAPVWIGEMGASMKSSDSKAWASTLLGYMNGAYGAQGGPTFSGNQQPVSGSWWVVGPQSDNPDGTQTAWGPGHYRPEQQAITDQMLFKPASGGTTSGTTTTFGTTTTSGTASPNATIVTGSTGSITDAQGKVWTIAGGQVAVNGTPDTLTSGVIKLAYVNGTVWQENSADRWGAWNSATSVWGPTNGTSTPPISATVEAISTGSTTMIDGTIAGQTTSQGATVDLSAPGTAQVVLGSTADTLTFIGMSSVSLTAGTANAVVTADGGTNSFVAGSGTLDVTGGHGADAYTFQAGDGLLKIEDFSFAKGDTLTVDKSLQAGFSQTSDGHGGVLIGFGTSGHGIDLVGVSSIQASQLHFV